MVGFPSQRPQRKAKDLAEQKRVVARYFEGGYGFPDPDFDPTNKIHIKWLLSHARDFEEEERKEGNVQEGTGTGIAQDEEAKQINRKSGGENGNGNDRAEYGDEYGNEFGREFGGEYGREYGRENEGEHGGEYGREFGNGKGEKDKEFSGDRILSR